MLILNCKIYSFNSFGGGPKSNYFFCCHFKFSPPTLLLILSHLSDHINKAYIQTLFVDPILPNQFLLTFNNNNNNPQK